jgi:hypothetical protein
MGENLTMGAIQMIVGNVTITGLQRDVGALFEELEDYYDKRIVSHGGTIEEYELCFAFSIQGSSFFAHGDYFLVYSEDFACHVLAEMRMPDDSVIVLEYDSGEVIKGVENYDLNGI